jgi:hypothetical protein
MDEGLGVQAEGVDVRVFTGSGLDFSDLGSVCGSLLR